MFSTSYLLLERLYEVLVYYDNIYTLIISAACNYYLEKRDRLITEQENKLQIAKAKLKVEQEVFNSEKG